MKKIISLVLALALVMSLAIGAAAEETGTITIKPPQGVDAGATNTYKIYKVFDADGNGTTISYRLVAGKTTAPAGFTVDAAGNVTYTGTGTNNTLTTADIAAIAGYVTDADLVKTVTATGSANAVAKNIPNGYYYITTSTGTVVTIDSTNPNATVEDKTTAPVVTKVISAASSFDADGKKALAQVGTDVEYTATIKVGAGAKGYVFHDVMEIGFTYNKDVKLSIDGTTIGPENYTVGKEGSDTFTITIEDEYIKTLAKDSLITVKYSAKVNGDTLTTDPAENTAYVSYGDPSSNNKTPEAKTAVYNAKFTVTKQDGDNQPLAGAGFVVSRQVKDTTEGAAENATVTQYYRLDAGVVSWVTDIADATEYTSDAEGKVTAFTGLANGEYTLIENTVPAGYNKAADVNFTVAANTYEAENLEQNATVVNQVGSTLPSTGGMGTTIFYILGGLLTVGALVLLVTKKRMTAE